MIKLNDFWALLHSQYSEDNNMYPWHIEPLGDSIELNLKDCIYNNRYDNKWQIVFISQDFLACVERIDQLTLTKQTQGKNGQKLFNRAGYIYVIKADTGHYKIGRTRNIPNRMKLFAVKLPFDFEIIHTFPCDDTNQAENYIHDRFKEGGCHVRGELFNLSDKQLKLLKSIKYFEGGKYYAPES